MAARRKKPKIGDVFQVSLPNGRFAYGRVFKDADVAIYRTRTDKPGLPPIGSRDVLFHTGIYDDIVGSEQCPIVGHDPFVSEEDSWPPPTCIRDTISGELSIYHRGEIVPSDEQSCRGLREAEVGELRHLVDEIMTHEK